MGGIWYVILVESIKLYREDFMNQWKALYDFHIKQNKTTTKIVWIVVLKREIGERLFLYFCWYYC